MINVRELLSVVRAVRNPQQAQTKMLDYIGNKRPELASVLRDMINNGTSPKVAFSQAIEAGQINREQFYEARNLFRQYNRFLPFKISNQDWNELENVINNQQQNNNGFRF